MALSEERFSGGRPGDLDAEALLALGRLDGALGAAGPLTLRLFAHRLLRDMLVTALRQEGHMFTDQRFHAWFAGVATLSDDPPRAGRPPRAMCEAILTELTHSRWELIAELSARFRTAFLAPGDHIGSDLAAETAHQDVCAIIAAARTLLDGLPPSPNPLTAIADLHRAASAHRHFAPTETAPEPIALGTLRLPVERAGPRSPRWAIEMLWGSHWQAQGLLSHAVPFPGLIRLDASGGDRFGEPGNPDRSAEVQACSLRDVALGLFTCLSRADRLAGRIIAGKAGKRRTSRGPALLELLAGFGTLRSAQLETLLGATRLGLRGILGTIDEAGMLERRTLSGVHLYAVNLETDTINKSRDLGIDSSFSSAALGEYDAAMAEIDALLSRSGGDFSPIKDE